MTRLALFSSIALLLTLFSGCTVTAGLAATQRGLAQVDVELDRWLEEFVQATKEVRAWCSVQDDREACELKWGVTDGDVAAVEQAVTLMRSGYDDTAQGLEKMAKAWVLLLPRLQRVVDAAEEVRRL